MTEQTTAIVSTFGERSEVKELAERIKSMMPGGQNYTLPEAYTLAQIAVAHELDPFNGEVWLIKDPDSGKVYGALIGIKGHRKHAKRQADYWGEFVRITEPKQYNAPDGSIVYEYHIHDKKTLDAYSDSLERLVKMGVPLTDAQKITGRFPVAIGIGIWSPGDKTKMKPAQCAMFRAEKDALKRRFDVKFRVELQDGRVIPVTTSKVDDDPDAEEVEAEYAEIAGDEPRDEDEVMGELGFDPGTPPEPERELDAADVLVADGKIDHAAHARNIIAKRKNTSPLNPYQFVVAYMGWKDMGATSEQAAANANKGEMPK